MEAARWLPESRDGVRLLIIDPTARSFAERRFIELPDVLEPGDLLVLNDAATLPASLGGSDAEARPMEARLLAAAPDDTFWAALLGAGDWRQRTEDRPPPPPVALGTRLMFGGLEAHVVEQSPLSPRLVRLAFNVQGAALWAALYQHGKPIQYSHVMRSLPLWAVQTVYAARPWAFEMPSAGRPFSWEMLLSLRERGVRSAVVTHAAGLSATGDPAIDRGLPLKERFEIPPATVAAVDRAREVGGRVVAVGTTVVRALEGAVAEWGLLRSGQGETDLRLGSSYEPRIVHGVISGLHAPTESHFSLLSAFAGKELLGEAWAHAEAKGFHSHEMGDAVLVLPATSARRAPASLPRSVPTLGRTWRR
jgi:S-adenosylmethionine:tRNA ribosyltransferase-isomerase